MFWRLLLITFSLAVLRSTTAGESGDCSTLTTCPECQKNSECSWMLCNAPPEASCVKTANATDETCQPAANGSCSAVTSPKPDVTDQPADQSSAKPSGPPTKPPPVPTTAHPTTQSAAPTTAVTPSNKTTGAPTAAPTNTSTSAAGPTAAPTLPANTTGTASPPSNSTSPTKSPLPPHRRPAEEVHLRRRQLCRQASCWCSACRAVIFFLYKFCQVQGPQLPHPLNSRLPSLPTLSLRPVAFSNSVSKQFLLFPLVL
ncbi:hypothetical protein SKAU_G00184690 [Synaphobranchus kaupii]|uniref:Uncharacterized protein n=1 Tax=Synaphobranchus kaupii TaxID=118154 RepID=A0A9Q1IWU6_SYNKA|nr:hypothetical protein SKAU_G00184690 [Synaphobranchus kaupii]